MFKKKDFDDNQKGEVIVKRSCDESMARRKGFLPCDKNCKQCLACIEHLRGGERRHFNPKR